MVTDHQPDIAKRSTLALKKLNTKITVKTGEGKVRQETNSKSNQETYDRELDNRTGDLLVKTRCLISFKGYTIEVDVFEGMLSGLIIAEVEFDNLAEANEFTPPSWFGEEISDRKDYRNKSLAMHGMPRH